ncbi:hypothetical protein N0V84_008764 [Fusarium piperis]|uniref:Uncharacterized protein n=1 Tax=Fusarium piperis TaxID=1435070 RepID=A0A9W9BJY9_9HYPO|nr:hypothetical protein N0V84_008764 [Fusarium piperis]
MESNTINVAPDTSDMEYNTSDMEYNTSDMESDTTIRLHKNSGPGKEPIARTGNTPTGPRSQRVVGPAQDIARGVPQLQVYRPPNTDRRPAPSPGEANSRGPPPKDLISKATLEYLGFTPRKAAQMWTNWVEWPSGLIRRETDPDDERAIVTYQWYIMRHVLFTRDKEEKDLFDWSGCLEGYGLCRGAQEYILDYVSGYPHLPRQKCSVWSAYTLEYHYEELRALLRKNWADRTMGISNPESSSSKSLRQGDQPPPGPPPRGPRLLSSLIQRRSG